MILRQLSIAEAESIYYEHMKKDFPPEELKPFEVMEKLVNKEIYLFYGLYEKCELLGYAFLVTLDSYILIDYYATCKMHRSKGIGSKFLNLLKEEFKEYDGMMVEVEKIEDVSDESEKIIRKRRIDFYNTNGMRMTKISIILFGVNYSIMCFSSNALDDLSIYRGLERIYKEIVPYKLFIEYVKLSIE